MIQGGLGSEGGLEDATTSRSHFLPHTPGPAPGLKPRPHLLPQGGVQGNTEYDHKYRELDPEESRLLPPWYTWSQQRSPFGLEARTPGRSPAYSPGPQHRAGPRFSAYSPELPHSPVRSSVPPPSLPPPLSPPPAPPPAPVLPPSLSRSVERLQPTDLKPGWR